MNIVILPVVCSFAPLTRFGAERTVRLRLKMLGSVLALPREGQEFPSVPPLILATLQMGMSNNDEIRRLANRMDEAFCARMRKAIEAGLERALVGVTPLPGPAIQSTSQQNPCR